LQIKREKTTQDRIIRWLKSLPQDQCWYFKVCGAPFQKRGVPDILCCIRGLFIGLEVKAPDGKITAMQLKQIELIRRAGGAAAVVHSLADAKHLIKSFLNEEYADV